MSSLFGPFKYKLSLRYGEWRPYGTETLKERVGLLNIEIRNPGEYRFDFNISNEEIEQMENGDRMGTGIVRGCGDPFMEVPVRRLERYKKETKGSLTKFLKGARLIGDFSEREGFYLELQRSKKWEEITIPELSTLLVEKAERLETPLITMPVKWRYAAGGGIAAAALAVLASVVFNPAERDYDVTRYLLQKYYDGLPETGQRSLKDDMEYGGIDTLPATEMQEAEEIFERRFHRNAPSFIQEERRKRE